MSNDKLRRQITYEAARMLLARQESEFYRAKLKAARRICQGWARPGDLPTDREIREEIQALTRLRDPGSEAPDDGLEVPSEQPLASDSVLHADRFQVYQMLLLPLETVRQSPDSHPEGDALYHSLQVFDLAREELPYDEEFQSAALLHDVGKAIDPRDHVTAALSALNGHITERTAWLIAHHADAQALRDGTLGIRARHRLEAAEDFDTLMLLSQCDRRGRQRGVPAPDVEEALEHLRELARANDD